MADNVQVTPGSGSTIAADEVTIGGNTVKTQRVKLGHGADGSYDGDVSKVNGLPVQSSQPASLYAQFTVAFGTFTGSFANLSVTNWGNASRALVINDSDGTIELSQDGGTTLHHVLLPRTSRVISRVSGGSALWGRYKSGLAPTVGNVLIELEA